MGYSESLRLRLLCDILKILLLTLERLLFKTVYWASPEHEMMVAETSGWMELQVQHKYQ